MVRPAMLVLALAMLAFPVHAGKPVVDGPVGKSIDRLLTRYAEYGLSGTFLVAKDGRIVLHKGYGFADREKRVSNTTDTLFEMASITKTFTSAAVLKLESEGRLRTSDLLSKSLGEFPVPKSSATIDHLLKHKGGLIVEGATLPSDGTDRDRFVDDMKKTPAESAPGEQYRYTNAGYSVVAALIEAVTGQTYESWVRANLLVPAGMKDSGFRGDFLQDRRMAKGYLGTPAKIEEGPPLAYLWGTRGAGGLITTVGDTYKWVLALEGTGILSEDAKRKMFAQAATEQYGWHSVLDQRGKPRIDKGGGQVNFATHIIRLPSDGVVVVFATNNLQQRWRRVLTSNLPKAAMGQAALTPPAPHRLDSRSLTRWTGTFRDSTGGEVFIKAGDGFLYLETKEESLPTTVLFFPTKKKTFHGVETAQDRIVSLTFDAEGVSLHSGKTERRFTRVKPMD